MMKIKFLSASLFALVAVLGLAAAPLASAAPHVHGGVVVACLKTKGSKKTAGTLRVANSAKECKRKRGETPISWNLAGATVPAAGTESKSGSPGAAGPQGPSGERGLQGEKGAAGTVEKKTRRNDHLPRPKKSNSWAAKSPR